MPVEMIPPCPVGDFPTSNDSRLRAESGAIRDAARFDSGWQRVAWLEFVIRI